MWKAETKIMVVKMKWQCKIRNLKENGKMHSYGVPELRTYNRKKCFIHNLWTDLHTETGYIYSNFYKTGI
jgi:hypothetical protein